MATDKQYNVNSDIHSSSDHDEGDERLKESGDKSPEIEFSRMGKALAHRALYGSNTNRRGKSRKFRNQDIKTLPSRLSKVSLADETADTSPRLPD